MSIWWCPGPPEGETVPDYPPVELTDDVVSVSLLRPGVPPWAQRLVDDKDDSPPEMRLGDYPEEP